MKIKSGFIGMMVVFSLLLACKGESNKKKLRLLKQMPKSMINVQLLYSELDKEFSFPAWFDAALISKNEIKRIVRNIYPRQEQGLQIDTTGQVPREQLIYNFSKSGKILELKHLYYYDDRVISQYVFRYASNKDNSFFNQVILDSARRFVDKVPLPDYGGKNSDIYHIYDEVDQNKDYSIYKNRQSGDFLFVVKNKKIWGPLEIDRILQPTPKDKIILGTWKEPKKIYQVENKVKENHVREYKYRKGAIHQIVRYDYPFRIERSFLYNQKGYCRGFIDSTFSDSDYLTRVTSDWKLNQFQTPDYVTYRKENPKRQGVFTYIEGFQYEFWK
jgi:hypothetical protein